MTIARCPTCGLTVDGPEADHFWQLDENVRTFSAKRAEALDHLRRQRAPVSGPTERQEPDTRERFEHWAQRWTVRDLLLVLGVFSLIAAIVSFAVVTWDDLNTAGRVGLVVSITMIVGGIAYAMDKREMRATAEAITALWAALLVADVAAGRVLLFEESPPLLVWGGGLAIVAGLLAAFALFSETRSAPILGLIAASLPLPLVALNEGSQILAATAGLLGFIVLRAVAGLTAEPAAQLERIVSTALQVLSWSFSAFAVLLGLAWNGGWGISAHLVITGLLLGAAVWSSSLPLARFTHLSMGLSTALFVVAPTVLTARWTDGAWPVLAAAVSAGLVLAVASRASHPGKLGALAVAGVVLLMVSTLIVVMLAWAVGRTLEPTLDPWTGTASERLIIEDLRESEDQFTALAILATWMLAVFDALRGQRQLWWGVLGAFALITVVLGLTILGAPVWLAAALLVALGVATLAAPSGSDHLEVDAVAVVLTALGVSVSIATPELTIGALAAIAVSHATLSYRSSLGTIRSGWLFLSAFAAVVGVAFAVSTNEGFGQGTVGLVVLVTAGVLTLALPLVAFWRQADHVALGRYLLHVNTQWILEGAAVLTAAAAVIGVSARGSSGQFTAALLIAAGFCVAHAVRPGRHWLVVAATALAARATVVQLRAADVSLVEAYAAPAAVVAAVFGYYAYRSQFLESGSSISSWISFGPGIAAAVGPSLVVSLGRDGGPRPLLLPVVGALLIGFGLSRRLQAPVVLGAGVVAAIGTDFLITFAADLPRWIPFGLVGLLLVFLGADFDRNRQRASGLLLLVKELR